MSSLIVLGLAAAVLITAIASIGAARAQQPPPVIYVQTMPAEPEGGSTGCLPLLILLAVILAVIAVG